MLKKKGERMPDYEKKSSRKVWKVLIQASIILCLAFIVLGSFIEYNKFDEPDRTEWANTKGFIALSYFGVDRNGTVKRIGKKDLEKQLKALVDQGYETVSQQDILDFYDEGLPLPEKALYLSFEDGRNDSSIFAHPLLRKYNYKATFLTYANKMGNSEHKFLQPKDLVQMKKSGYWELGSNGYRLTYINIFDHDGQYIGVKDENELVNKESIEFYNHYTMDFIRNENMIPLENKEEMEKRISGEYELIKKVYEKEIGYVPQVYMIMHANALHRAANNLVSQVNADKIEKTFAMHFNFEGEAFNDSSSDVYNLTRVQPEPFWSTNHLLMKIQKDTGEPVEFITGEQKWASAWKQMSGAAEFLEDRIILTSDPSKVGRIYLEESKGASDVEIETTLSGNVVGKQAIYVRYNKEQNSYLRIAIENNEVHVEEKKPGKVKKILGVYELSDVESSAEDLSFNKATVYTLAQMLEARDSTSKYPINLKGNRHLKISLKGDQLAIKVDGDWIVKGEQVDEAINSGGILLESAFHKLNHKDDIYDGVFENLTVQTSNESYPDNVTIFSNTLDGFAKVIDRIKSTINLAVNWIIEVF